MNKLVTVTNKEILSKLKKEDVTKVYPLRFFSVGYNEYFDISEIDDFCLINRILTDDDLDKLDNILKNSNIKGILFDDLGVLDIIKNLNIILFDAEKTIMTKKEDLKEKFKYNQNIYRRPHQ